MLYTVAQISDLTSLSKVTVYNKIKSLKLQNYITKKQGITYLSEEGLNAIKEDLKSNKDFKKEVKTEEKKEEEKRTETKSEDETTIINRELVKALMDQLKEKDKQIADLHRLIENSQVLLKKPDDSKILDNETAATIVEEQPKKGFLKKLFGK